VGSREVQGTPLKLALMGVGAAYRTWTAPVRESANIFLLSREEAKRQQAPWGNLQPLVQGATQKESSKSMSGPARCERSRTEQANSCSLLLADEQFQDATAVRGRKAP
jgi:hypothetical protein